jgi:hypothetical protein
MSEPLRTFHPISFFRLHSKRLRWLGNEQITTGRSVPAPDAEFEGIRHDEPVPV